MTLACSPICSLITLLKSNVGQQIFVVGLLDEVVGKLYFVYSRQTSPVHTPSLKLNYAKKNKNAIEYQQPDLLNESPVPGERSFNSSILEAEIHQ